MSKILGALLALALAITSPMAAASDLGNVLGILAQGPTKVLVSETLGINPNTMQMISLKFHINTRVRINISGVRDTGNGFRVVLVPEGELANYRSRGRYNFVPQFSEQRAVAFDRHAVLHRGSYVLLIENAYNLVRPMYVQLSVVQNP
jgi:hypothetical protein